MKPKFEEEPPQVYISHAVLHKIHPILKKLSIDDVQRLLAASNVLYLQQGQILYRKNVEDPFVYIILFGTLRLADVVNEEELATRHIFGKVNIGWTLGEEILFDRTRQTRAEMVFAEDDCCLLGIEREKLGSVQKEMLAEGRTSEYFVLESTLKGNFIIKEQWRQE